MEMHMGGANQMCEDCGVWCGDCECAPPCVEHSEKLHEWEGTGHFSNKRICTQCEKNKLEAKVAGIMHKLNAVIETIKTGDDRC
jgi:hypothetical protein